MTTERPKHLRYPSIETEIGLRRLIDRYCLGVIHRDAEVWGSTWTDDATWFLGPGREVQGKEAIVQLWTTAMGAFNRVIQTPLHCSFDIDETAGTGSGRNVIRERFERSDGTMGNLWATYIDTYRRIDDLWLFSSRSLEIIERS